MTHPIYVLDTETSTTHFKPYIDGHIVEIGIVEVDLERQKAIPFYHSIINDPKAKEEAWVFNNTTLTMDVMRKGRDKGQISQYLSHILGGSEVTAFNTSFDQLMVSRDMKEFDSSIRWGECLMKDSARIEEIPRKHANSNAYPTAQDTYNHLCPDDPAGINGIEEHRAQSDAYMEAFILIELYNNGLYTPLSDQEGD